MARDFIAILIAVSALASSALPAANAQEFNQGNPECINADASTGLLEAAAEVPELSTLVAAVKAAGATDAFEDTSKKVTAFMPTNEAFENVTAELGLKSVDELLASPLLGDILRYHVVGDPHTSDYFVDGVELPTREGDSLQGFDETTILAANGNATIMEADVFTCQGVVEVVDKVLLPPSVVEVLGAASNETAGNSTAVIGGVAGAGEGGSAVAGGGGGSDDSDEGSGGRHECTACPEECVAAPGFTESNGITDDLCSQCADGYQYWPCLGDDAPSGGCICAGAGNQLPVVCDLGEALINGTCTTCPEGQVPTQNGDGCEDPLDPDFGVDETPGNQLPVVCDLGEALINGTCTTCPEGQVPTQNGDGCEDPLDPDFGKCPSGQVLNETTGDCQVRPPLMGPGNPLPPTCDFGEVLINKKCTNCTEGQVPNESGDGCVDLDPDFGQCPSGIKDEATGECITCKPNEYLRPPDSTNGEKWTCEACPPYQAPYPDKSGCEKCSDNGKVPSEDGSECVDLDPGFGMCPSGIKDEATGECVTCKSNQYPNPDKGQCEDCPEGQVPVNPSDTYRAENSSLAGSTSNPEPGKCKCPDGEIKDEATGKCVVDCEEGKVPNESGDGCKPDPDAPNGEKGLWCPIPCWDGQGNPPITHDWCQRNCGTVQNPAAACSADGVLNLHDYRCQDCSTIKWANPDCNRSKNEALNGTSSDDGKDCKDPRGCDEDTAEMETAGTLEMPTLPGGEKNDNQGDQTQSAGTMDLPDPKDDPKDKDKASAGTLNLGAPSGSGDAEEESGLLG